MKRLICYMFIFMHFLSIGCSKLIPEDIDKVNLKLLISCGKTDIKLGDAIPITFEITNVGSVPYDYNYRSYDRCGRLYEFELTAIDINGQIVPDPRADSNCLLLGGLGNEDRILKTSQSFTKTIELNRWAIIEKPGTYKVNAFYHAEIADSNGNEGIIKSDSIDVNIKPRSDKEMIRHIDNLITLLKVTKARENFTYQQKQNQLKKRERLIKKLIYTLHPAAMSVLVDLVYEDYHRNDIYWAQEAFHYYLTNKSEGKRVILQKIDEKGLAPSILYLLRQTDATKNDFARLIPIALNSNNPEILSDGVAATSMFPDDSYMPRLIKLAMDTNSPARIEAIDAIANNRTDEGVQALRKLLKDKNDSIRETTYRSIISAYEKSSGRPLREGDFKDALKECYMEQF